MGRVSTAAVNSWALKGIMAERAGLSCLAWFSLLPLLNCAGPLRKGPFTHYSSWKAIQSKN